MAANGDVNGGGYWKYLIRHDRSATSQLQDLCVGLAGVVRDLEPGPDSELTPQRLAAFYRLTGANYDNLFLNTDNHGISFMYRTLGCRHSLQPTSNDFETPSVPCLTSSGFARWQTLQLLLCPDDSVRSIQKAVQIWDIPRPDGGYFPKSIPTNCFPERPDEAMEKWYKHVSGSLNQDNYMRRLKNSPYQSPHPDGHDRKDGYFAHSGRPSRPSRQHSYDDEARAASYRRRSSVPEAVSPLPEGAERGSHWDPATRHERKTRSHSAQRSALTRQRSGTNPATSLHHSKHHQASSSASQRYDSNPDQVHSHSRPPSSYSHHYRPRSSGNQLNSSSTVDEDAGSEASSETSHNGHRSHHRKADEERQSRGSSLWPPSFFKSKLHKRRHSSDTSPRKIEAKPPLPLRPECYGRKPTKCEPPQPVLQSPYKPSPGVRFRDDIFKDDAVSSAPETLVHGHNGPPVTHYPNGQPTYPRRQMEGMQMVGQPLSRENSSSSGTERRYNSDFDRLAQRKAGAPIRVSTVTGVGGRKYANTERGLGERETQHARVRGSLPALA